MAAAHAAGKAVHVWTVNEAESMYRLLALGVDGIISDVPTVLCSVLAACRNCLGRLSPVLRRAGQGSAAPAVRLLAVVGLLLRPELALDRSLRHGVDSLDGRRQAVR